MLNTVVGALATYGLVGLRYQGRALVLFSVIVVIQSLVAIQLMTFCVWLTPNQVIFLPLDVMLHTTHFLCAHLPTGE